MRILYINGEREYLTNPSALPILMKSRRHSARVMMPLYGELQIRFGEQLTFLGSFPVQGFREKVGLFSLNHQGVIYYFLENPHYFGAGKRYDPGADQKRFLFFCRSVVAVIHHLDFTAEVIHLKGWRSALVSLFLHNSGHKTIPVLFELGHLWEQGGLNHDILPLIPELSPKVQELLRTESAFSFMGIGMLYSHQLVAASPELAKDLLSPTSPVQMDALFRSLYPKLSGIAPATDKKRWNPLKDPELEAVFGRGDLRRRRPNRPIAAAYFGCPIEECILFAIAHTAPLPKDCAIPILDEHSAFYTQALAGCDFVLTSEEHLGQVLSYGALPIYPQYRLIPPIVAKLEERGGAVIWKAYAGENLDIAVQKAKELFQQTTDLTPLRILAMEEVRGYPEYCQDFLSLYKKILKNHPK